MLIFDCETGALDDVALAVLCPDFTPDPPPGEFDPATVKYGNTKDEAKRAIILAEKKAAHEAAVIDYDQYCCRAAQDHFANFKSGAALDPTTGRILAIGVQDADSGKCGIDDGGGDEATLITKFWAKYVKCRSQAGGPRKMVGANIFGFDLPFLIRRSWILGVEVPASVRNGSRYFDQLFVDIRDVWLCGQRWNDCESSLGAMARALNCGSKNGHGGDFARLWFGTAEERNQAVAYLRNDLAMTAAVAKKLGVV